MKITFESDILIPAISKVIDKLTDTSTVCLDDIHYDEAKGIVEIYLQRNEITGFTTPFWFWMWGRDKPVYGQARVKSRLTIRQVEGMEIVIDDRLITEHNSCFTLESGILLGGIQTDRNIVYLRSLEDASGKAFCRVQIKVKKWDVAYTEAVLKI